MGFLSDKCPSCGEKVRKSASFCPHCGKPAPQARLACPSCGREVRSGAKFCPQCGAPVAGGGDESAVDEMNRWRRDPLEFARRIEAADLRGALTRGLVVEPGTQAMIFQGGALAGTVTAGTYDLSSPLGEIDAAAPATAVLMDAGDVTLGIGYEGLRTAEGMPVDAMFLVVVRLSDAAALHANLMHGRTSLPVDSLGKLLANTAADVIRARVKGVPAAELRGNLPLKNAIEADLRAGVSPALERSGLTLVELRLAEFGGEVYERITGIRGRLYVAEELVAEAEQRAELRQRSREAVKRDEIGARAATEEVRDFDRQLSHDARMKERIRAEEQESLRREQRHAAEGAERAYAHGTELQDIAHETQADRARRALDAERLDDRLQQGRKVGAAGRDENFQDATHKQRIADLKRRQAAADAESELQRDIREGEAGLKLRSQKVHVDDEEERMRIEKERIRAEIAQDMADREAKRELEMIRALSEAEQSRLAADLRKTETMKDMTEGQIMALVAENSPHVAAALAERYKAEAQTAMGDEMRALYDKLLAGKDAEADRMERIMDKALGSVERVAGAAATRDGQQRQEVKDLASQSMDRMADVAAARAAAGGQADGRPTLVVCPKCDAKVPADMKFCDSCGQQMGN